MMGNNYEATPNGIKKGNRVIGYSSLIRQLDEGEYDMDLPEGMRLLSYVWDGVAAKYLTLSLEKQLIIWRWVVVAAFICEQRLANGIAEVPNGRGGVDIAVIYSGVNGAMSVYPGPARFSLANHVEGCAIKKYGVEKGLPLALAMYQDMVESGTMGIQLSTMGREGMNMLHDEYVELIHTDGIPSMPVVH